jgi:hypothetical protein
LTHHEGLPQAVLQGLEALGDGGRRHRKTPGCSFKAAFFQDSRKGSELGMQKIHRKFAKVRKPNDDKELLAGLK